MNDYNIIKKTINNMPANIFNLFMKHKKEIKYDSIDFKYLFTFLGAGSEGIVYEINNYAIKIIYNKKSLTNPKEIKILKLCKELISKKVTNNFLELYDNFKKDSCEILILNLIDGNLLHWFTKTHTDTEWINMLLQLTYTILVMQQCLKIYHSDLKPKNILYKMLTQEKLISYTIKTKTETIYFSLSTNIIFYISDFGTAESLLLENNDMSKQSIKLHIQKNTDMIDILSFYNRLIVSIVQNSYTLKDLTELGKSDPFFVEYQKTETEKINKKFNIHQSAKNKLLLRSLIYYLLEKKLLNVNTIKSTDKIKLPSAHIRNILESLSPESPTLDIIKSLLTYHKNVPNKNIPYIELCIKL